MLRSIPTLPGPRAQRFDEYWDVCAENKQPPHSPTPRGCLFPPQHPWAGWPGARPHLVGEGFSVQAQVLLQLQLLHRLAVILGDDLGHCRAERGARGGRRQRRGCPPPPGTSAQPPPAGRDTHVPAIRLQLPMRHHCLWHHQFTRLGGTGGTGELPPGRGHGRRDPAPHSPLLKDLSARWLVPRAARRRCCSPCPISSCGQTSPRSAGGSPRAQPTPPGHRGDGKGLQNGV